VSHERVRHGSARIDEDFARRLTEQRVLLRRLQSGKTEIDRMIAKSMQLIAESAPLVRRASGGERG
jgi:hypothetical protein